MRQLERLQEREREQRMTERELGRRNAREQMQQHGGEPEERHELVLVAHRSWLVQVQTRQRQRKQMGQRQPRGDGREQVREHYVQVVHRFWRQLVRTQQHGTLVRELEPIGRLVPEPREQHGKLVQELEQEPNGRLEPVPMQPVRVAHRFSLEPQQRQPQMNQGWHSCSQTRLRRNPPEPR